MPKRTPVKLEDLSADTQKLFDILNHEPDLPVIVVAAAYLDACLGSILQRHFKAGSTSSKLLDPKGLLGSFGARNDICYVLGLIAKDVHHDLSRIAEIRNLVAHHYLALDLSTPDVVTLVDELVYVDKFWDIKKGDSLNLTTAKVGGRNRFVMTAVLISQRLLVDGLSIKPQALPAS